MEWREINLDAAESEVVIVKHQERVKALKREREREIELQGTGSVNMYV